MWCIFPSTGLPFVRVMVWFLIFFVITSTLSASASIGDAVVEIRVTKRGYSYQLPWAPPALSREGGSGFVIEGGRILTNAHVVADASFVEVYSADSNRGYEASVKLVGHDCDLALLEVGDTRFFHGKGYLTIHECMAAQEEEVQVYGFPMGGQGLAVTRGVISRIEMGHYAHSGSVLLTSQIDAPVNYGSSGGPVILEGRVVGVVYGGSVCGQNIGYMIPVPVVRHFLQEAEMGGYLGFPQFPLTTQVIHNSAMRQYLGLKDNTGGLLVTHVPEDHFLHDVVRAGDILVGVDGHDIDCSGYIYYQKEKLALPFRYAVIMKYFGDLIELDVLRKGEILHFTAQVDYRWRGQPLVKPFEYGKAPSYYILGGMVYQPLVGNFLDQDFSPSLVELLPYFLKGRRVRDGREEVVVLTHVLDDEINIGYQYLKNEVVKKVNGCNIRNIQEMVDVCSRCSAPYYEIVMESGFEVVLYRDSVAERDPKILQRYSIPSDRSDDLKRVR